MPQNNVLPAWRVDYPLLAPAQKPGGVTVATTATAPRVPNKHTYSAGSVLGAVFATGTITLNDNTMTNQNINVNGTLVTFGTNVTVAGTTALTTTNMLNFLQGSVDANISQMTYSAQSATVILCTSKVAGSAGNALTLTNGTSTTHVTVSGPTLTGGLLPGGLSVEPAAAEAAVEEEAEEEAEEEDEDEDEPTPRGRRGRRR